MSGKCPRLPPEHRQLLGQAVQEILCLAPPHEVAGSVVDVLDAGLERKLDVLLVDAVRVLLGMKPLQRARK
jgi:hypothetical protein